jgi:serine/threonine protein kinase
MASAAADRNLLFGILAVQMDFVSAEQLILAMNAWVLNKGRPLGAHLIDGGALAADTHALIEALVGKHIEQHGGRVEQSLAALSSVEPVRQELAAIADADVQATLARVSAPTPPGDRHATLAVPQPKSASANQRFHILRPHAAGGLGKVSVARDAELNREVALKELHDRHADNPDSRARFLQEAEITGGLEHPGVVPIYGLGQYADGRPFYAMRFIRGDSLAQAIERFHREADAKWSNPADVLQLRRLLSRFLDVCNAMDYAHSRGVLHRDLKPGNIMLGQYGETLVVDWGLAKPLGVSEHAAPAADATIPPSHEAALTPQSGSGSAPTQMGSALGTPAYMSPEQAAGRLDQLGPASDVYSLGATLYVLLTGRAPQEDDDLGIVLQRVQRGEFPAPRSLKPVIPRGLEAICLKAMALQAKSRYPSARQLADDVEAWLADEPVNALPESIPAQAFRWVKNHRTLVTSGAAMVLAALLVLAAVNIQLRAVNERERDAKNAAIAAQKKAEAAQAEAERQTARNEELLALARKSLERYKTLSESEEFNRYGMEKLRSDLLEAALDFYATLAHQTGESETARADRGDALYRLGWTYSQLGRLDQAREALNTSLAIYRELESEFPTNLVYARSAASAVVSIAEMLNDSRDSAAGELLAESRRRVQALRLKDPQGLDATLRLAYLTTLEGERLWQLGKMEEAAAAVQEGVELLEGIDLTALDTAQNQNIRYRLGRSLSQLASLETEALWRFPEARKHLDQAAELMRTLFTETPASSDVGYSLVQVLRKSGFLYGREHSYEPARRAYLEAIEVLTRIEERHPQVSHYRQEMAELLYSLGSLHRPFEEGDMSSEALVMLETAAAISTQLVEQYPLQIERRLSLARYQSSLAQAYLLRGRQDDANRRFDAVLKLLAEVGEEASNNVDALETLGDAQYIIAEQLGDVGRNAEALAMLDAAETNLKKLIELSPQYGEAYLSLGNVYIERSSCFNNENRFADAVVEIDRAAELSAKTQALTMAPWMRSGMQAIITLSKTLRWGYLKRIRDGALQALIAEGEYELAGDQARQLPGLSGEASDHYLAATMLAQAATAASGDAKLTDESRPRVIEPLAADAVRQLTLAWEKGYLRRRTGSFTALLRSNPDLKDLEKEPEFAILRDRADYADLIGRIEGEQPPAAKRPDDGSAPSK